MLRVSSIPLLTAPIVLSILLQACQDVTTRGGTDPPSSQPLLSIGTEETQVTQDLERINEIATAKGIVADHGSSFIYIDGTSAGRYVIVHETFSSRSKYKSITPIVGIEQDGLSIDCSYVRSIEDMTTISVGTYCRGRSEASLESIEDAISDEHLLTYSSSLPWLDKVGEVAGCEQPLGLDYAGHYVVRCQVGEGDETTEDLSIKVLSPDYRVIFSITGFELAPAMAEVDQRLLVFWGLRKNAHHEIVEKTLP